MFGITCLTKWIYYYTGFDLNLIGQQYAKTLLSTNQNTFTPINFDVAVKSDFSVAAMVLSDSTGKIIHAATKRLSTTDSAIGEAQAALLACKTTTSLGIYSLLLEGDAINIILAIQQPSIFKFWNFASIISDVNFHLLSLHS
ncbi:hypothetical protein SLA2020_307160 [Shorea laevis]